MRNTEIVDVRKAAGLLTASVDTVMIGRKWITTKGVVVRWIAAAFAGDAPDRAVYAGDKAALRRTLQVIAGTAADRGKVANRVDNALSGIYFPRRMGHWRDEKVDP